MNILLIGSGGREHALAWKIAQSPLVSKLYALTGSLGISHFAETIQAPQNDNEYIYAEILKNNIDLVVIGPEQPLVDGLVDFLTEKDILVFGPCQAASMLEGSKGFTRDLCHKFNIPSAEYARFSCADKAKEYLQTKPMPIVIKQDGLAAGKGVVVTSDRAEAIETIDLFFSNSDNPNIVIEECLVGEELSFFCLCDGSNAVAFGNAQDHKRLLNNDEGPNTGGMGAYSPAPLLTAELEQRIMQEIIHPTLKAMQANGSPFKGILYAGLMITETGPRLIEYNVRFGDPECQVLMRRLNDDIVPWLLAAAKGELPTNKQPSWSSKSAICVVMASEGYPHKSSAAQTIQGIAEANELSDIEIFYAAVKKNQNNEYETAGGRVLNVTAVADNLAQAKEQAYAAVDKITWPGAQWRTDISDKGLKALNAL